MELEAQSLVEGGRVEPLGHIHHHDDGSVALPPPLRAFDEWEVGLNLSWELDVWGKFRRAIESADARLEASPADAAF